MTIHSAHSLDSTAHAVMYTRNYRSRVNVPVIRRLCGVVTRYGSVDVLRNNANIVRPDWDRFLSVGTITVALVRKA